MYSLHIKEALNEKGFFEMKQNAEKMRFERTGLVPKDAEEYSNLKIWYEKLAAEKKIQKMRQNVYDLEMAGSQKRGLAILFNGKVIGDGNTGILGLRTVWARHWAPTNAHPLAAWPGREEFREEGDERYTSNYGRFLPIPRVPGNKTVAFKHRALNPVEVLDRVMPVPKLYAAVNLNDRGFFDATVDEEGIPYDDEDLDGNEHIVKNGDVAAKHLVGSSSFGNKNVQAGNAATAMGKVPVRGVMPPRRVSRLCPLADPFVSRAEKMEDAQKSETSFEKCMSNMKTVFGKINADRVAEQENITLKTNSNTGSGLYGVVGDKTRKGTKEENSFVIHSKNLHGTDPAGIIRERPRPTSPLADRADPQSDRRLAASLCDWFNILNAGKHGDAIARKNSNTSSNILQANTNTPFSQENSTSQYTTPDLNSSPFVGGTMSSLGLYTPSEHSPVYTEHRHA